MQLGAMDRKSLKTSLHYNMFRLLQTSGIKSSLEFLKPTTFRQTDVRHFLSSVAMVTRLWGESG